MLYMVISERISSSQDPLGSSYSAGTRLSGWGGGGRGEGGRAGGGGGGGGGGGRVGGGRDGEASETRQSKCLPTVFNLDFEKPECSFQCSWQHLL